MNCLKSYIDEQIRTIVYEDGVVATPGNTMGMGNPMTPTDTIPGTEPIVVGPHKKRKNTKNKICPKIKESLLDDEDKFYGANSDKKMVESWIRDNYKIDGNLTISDDLVVDCNNTVKIKNKSITSLTNSLFRWGKVGGMFDCYACKNLKSLEGAPEKVDGDFYCNNCDKLETLEGAPEKVGGNFDCSDCAKLKSLEGAPKKTGKDFYCNCCDSLKTLEGSPESVGRNFVCSDCVNLKSLEGAPKEVGNNFHCQECNNLKTLKGAPEKVGNKIFCVNSNNIKITDSDRKKYKIME